MDIDDELKENVNEVQDYVVVDVDSVVVIILNFEIERDKEEMNFRVKQKIDYDVEI